MRIVVGVLLVLAVAAAVFGIYGYSYHLGFAQGAAQSGQTPAPGAPYPMHPYGYGWYGPYGYGFHPFGFFGFLFPLLWIALLVVLFRALWRRGRCGRGPWVPGSSGEGGPRWLEEWHRRQHEPKSQSSTV